MQSFFVWCRDKEHRPYCADNAQADLCLHWVHMSEGLFSHVEAHIVKTGVYRVSGNILLFASLYLIKDLAPDHV